MGALFLVMLNKPAELARNLLPFPMIFVLVRKLCVTVPLYYKNEKYAYYYNITSSAIKNIYVT